MQHLRAFTLRCLDDDDRFDPVRDTDSIEYRVRLPLPTTFRETRASLAAMRRGLASMMARFEPDRFKSVEHVLDAFGERETLGGLRVQESMVEAVSLARSATGSLVVH